MLEIARELDQDLVEVVAGAIWDKKGFDVRAYDVREILDYTDCMVICSASSDRQAAAIAENVAADARTKLDLRPASSEGQREGRWALLDFGDVVVHVFHRPVRDYYELDRLYADAPRIELQVPEWDTSNDKAWASADDWASGGYTTDGDAVAEQTE